MVSKSENSKKGTIVIGIILILLAIGMIASWLGPCAKWWDVQDLKVFRAFNNTLEGNTAWSYFWAFTNWRGFDTIGFVAIGLFCLHWLRAKGRAKVGHRFLCMLAYVLLIGVFWVGSVVMEKVGPEGRVSNREAPSRVTENDGSGFIDITYRMSWAKAKVKSDNCFPSDHALLAVSMIAFFLMEASWGMKISSLIVLGFLPFPRTFSGAHWMTDVVIGGLSIVMLISATWLLTTSWRVKILAAIEKKSEIHLSRITKVFGVGLKK